MKTKIILIAAAAMLAAISLSSCEKIKGKGDVVTENRTVTGYSGVELSMSANVYVSIGPEYTLLLQGQQNVLDHIVTQVEDDRLVIKLKKGVHLGQHEPVRITVTAPEIHTLDISGSGDLYLENTWAGSDLSAHVSGSGNISINRMEAGQFTAHISGSGNIGVMEGWADREDLKISGSGTVDVRNTETKEVFTATSGSGDMFVWAVSLLEASISGSGNVYYLGNPIINTHISGSGNIRRL